MFNPLEVGNIMFIGEQEEEFIAAIENLIETSKEYPVYSVDVMNLLEEYNQFYPDLPQWIKDKIDMIDLRD